MAEDWIGQALRLVMANYLTSLAPAYKPPPRRPRHIQPGAKPNRRQAVTDVLFGSPGLGPRYPMKKTP
jgi:hypothetical protein